MHIKFNMVTMVRFISELRSHNVDKKIMPLIGSTNATTSVSFLQSITSTQCANSHPKGNHIEKFIVGLKNDTKQITGELIRK